MISKPIVCLSVSAVACAATGFVASASPGGGCPPDRARYEAETLPRRIPPHCNMQGKVITDHGVGIHVPDRDAGVYAHDTTSLGSEELLVRSLPDGEVVLDLVGSETEVTGDGAGGGSGPAECNDAGSNLHYWKVSDTNGFQWYFNKMSIPTYIVSDDDTLARIQAGGRNIAGSNNSCGVADYVSSANGLDYAGETSRGTNMTGEACGTTFDRDGISVVNFGPLPKTSDFTTYARACIWISGSSNGFGLVAESDIRINEHGSDVKFYVSDSPPSNCDTASLKDLEGLMTHERGRHYGIAHVSEDGHKNLTMSRLFNGSCQRSERSLGLGDADGLKTIYR